MSIIKEYHWRAAIHNDACEAAKIIMQGMHWELQEQIHQDRQKRKADKERDSRWAVYLETMRMAVVDVSFSQDDSGDVSEDDTEAGSSSKEADCSGATGDDTPFIVLTETKSSFRCIPVWDRYSPYRTRV